MEVGKGEAECHNAAECGVMELQGRRRRRRRR